MAMVPKRKAMELRMVMHNSMEGVHARNVEALTVAREELNEAEKEFAATAEVKDNMMADIFLARRDLLRAREIQERYMGSRIETVNPGGYALGIKCVALRVCGCGLGGGGGKVRGARGSWGVWGCENAGEMRVWVEGVGVCGCVS
jgi:hypothetical protein